MPSASFVVEAGGREDLSLPPPWHVEGAPPASTIGRTTGLPLVSGVSTRPGSMSATRTLLAWSSLRTACPRPTTPHLLAMYSGSPT